MSCDCKPISACTWEGSAPIMLGRFYGNSGALMTQASLSSITRTVTNKQTGTVISSGTLTISNVVFDTLQTDGRWTQDDVGYNFADQPPVASFATAGTIIQIVYTFTPTSGEVFKSDPFNITVKDLA